MILTVFGILFFIFNHLRSLKHSLMTYLRGFVQNDIILTFLFKIMVIFGNTDLEYSTFGTKTSLSFI